MNKLKSLGNDENHKIKIASDEEVKIASKIIEALIYNLPHDDVENI